MQRTFDSINSSGINYEDMMKMSNMSWNGHVWRKYGFRPGSRKSRSLRKKKENKKELPALDVSKLPAPHEIKRKVR